MSRSMVWKHPEASLEEYYFTAGNQVDGINREVPSGFLE
jgi:hypothetical protein